MIRIFVSTLVSPLAWGLLLMAAALVLSFTERFGRAARRALVALVALGWIHCAKHILGAGNARVA